MTPEQGKTRHTVLIGGAGKYRVSCKCGFKLSVIGTHDTAQKALESHANACVCWKLKSQ